MKLDNIKSAGFETKFGGAAKRPPMGLLRADSSDAAWGSIDAVYFAGGQPKVDGRKSGASLQNGRAGGTFAVPVTRRHSIKVFGSAGFSARTYSNFGLVGLAWQYRWGAASELLKTLTLGRAVLRCDEGFPITPARGPGP